MISFCTLDKLHERQRDPDERVRQEVVITICDAAAENISGVSDQVLLSLQREGLKERKEAVFFLMKSFVLSMIVKLSGHYWVRVLPRYI